MSPGRTPATDTDGDGVTDLKEFLAGTNPNSAESQFTIAQSALLPDGKLRLQWQTLPGRGYRVEGSVNGINWTPISSWVIAPGLLLTHELPAWTAGAPFLFRIEVRQ